MRVPRRVAAFVGVIALVITVVPVVGSTAAAAAEFRYWGYWIALPQAEDWTFSPLGPAFRPAVDGSVEGWRFAATSVVADAPPRATAATVFRDACGDTPAVDGRIRVAVLVDPGLTGDAPADEEPGPLALSCAILPEGATGMAALTAAVDVRIERGLVCGVAGYPRSECVAPVSADEESEPEPEPEPTGADRTSSDPTSADPTSTATSADPTSTATGSDTVAEPAVAAEAAPSATPLPAPTATALAAEPAPTPTGPGPWPLIGVGLVGCAVAAYALRRRGSS